MSSNVEKKWYFEASLKIKEIYDSCPEEWNSNLKSFFEKELPQVESELSWLNETPLHQLQTDRVVRFRGMIQDMLNPEFYMDTFVIKGIDGQEIKRPGRYMDMVTCKPNEKVLLDSPHCVTKDRNSYLCISIPGENTWVKEIFNQINPKYEINTSNCSAHGNKRSLPEDNNTELFLNNHQEKQQIENKKLKSKSSVDELAESSLGHFPLPGLNDLGCLLKTYEDYEVSLNDIVEVTGILSFDPLMSDCDITEPNHGFLTPFTFETKECSLPSSLIPRLHVISLQKLNHCNPLLPMVIDKDYHYPSSFNIRELIGSILDVAFLGDELASEYFICHLISSVYNRQDIIPIGKFSINISGISQDLQQKNYPKLLYKLIKNLTTHSHYFEMTVQNMNNINFVPKKDYETNCLKSGMLQLPKNFHLVIDETLLTPGKLESKGIANLSSLKTLIDWQKVDYDFQFHKLEQFTNIPVLILSEGKSLLNCDFHIKLDPKHTNVSEAFAQVESLLTNEVLPNIRKHLTLGRVSMYSFDENMQKMVQDDFVSSRRHEEGMTEWDLHKLLSLAKLLAQSCGKCELSEEIWKSSKMLEGERKGRLTNQP
ncbi:UNVERIFIED_CONTAM: hypothetical protein RMT77_002946 [Armadillidium vulgare]